jgi:hypothetical protein
MRHIHFFAVVLVGLFIFSAVGCGGPDSQFVRVEGTITFNGQPVDGATVTFQPINPDSGGAAAGTTDANGVFTLTSGQATRGGTGVLPGEYRVLVSKRPPPPPDPIQEAFDRGEIDYDELQRRRAAVSLRPATTGPTNLLPERYSRPSTTDLRATVVRGNNSPFNFDLTD